MPGIEKEVTPVPATGANFASHTCPPERLKEPLRHARGYVEAACISNTPETHGSGLKGLTTHCWRDRHDSTKVGVLSDERINNMIDRKIVGVGHLCLHAYSPLYGTSRKARLGRVPRVAGEAEPRAQHKCMAAAMRYTRRGTVFANNPATQARL